MTSEGNPGEKLENKDLKHESDQIHQVHAIFIPQPYNPKMNWHVWLELIEINMQTRGITSDNQKKLMLLQALGQDILERLMNWVAPEKPKEKSYTELVQVLETKFVKSINKYAARVKLFNEKQGDDQQVQEYIGHMTELAGKCSFDKMKNPYEENTVLAILRGLKDTVLREYLMNPSNDISTVTKLQTLAVQFQDNRRTAQEIVSSENKKLEVEINKVDKHQKTCVFCGEKHKFEKGLCKATDAKCFRCKETGHYGKCCKEATKFLKFRSKRQQNHHHKKKKHHRKVDEVLEDDEEESDGYDIMTVRGGKPRIPPYKIQMIINRKTVEAQVDCGAICTMINKKVWELIGKPKLSGNSYKLRSYTSTIETIGECTVPVQIDGKTKTAVLTVAREGDVLLGRDLIDEFDISVDKLRKNQCLMIKSTDPLANMLNRYEELFTTSNTPAKIEVELKCKEGVTPRFFKARGLPYSLREKVEKQLDERVKNGILKPIEYSDWASPIVAVRKSVNDVRICGDYKVAVNASLDTKQHPLPRIEDLLHELNGGEKFSKLDLKDAYHQLPLSEESKNIP